MISTNGFGGEPIFIIESQRGLTNIIMKGINEYKENKFFEGYTLFCETFLGPEEDKLTKGYVNLIDMKGEIVHRWEVETSLQSYCKLLEDGNLMYPTHDRSEIARGNAGLYELDPDSNIVWKLNCRIDHDCQMMDNGNILIHNITENFHPEISKGMKRHPYIVEINRNKELVWEWKGEEHYKDLKEHLSPEGWEHIVERVHGEFRFDWAHNNTTQIITENATNEKEKAEGENEIFKPGNIIFSYRSLDVIGVIDKETDDIIWAWGPGELDGQHKPHMLENGNILIFDNGTLRGYSRVIELNPLTEEIEWEYTASPKENFLSRYISGAQRLPNGNTLICEGAKAHLFEVTENKEVVWDFTNPYRYIENEKRNIYRCLRYSPEYVEPLLERI